MVYIAGTWDLLHAGHLSVLEKARASGDYLIVGIYSDPLASVLHARSKGRGRLRDGSSSGRQGAELDQEALCDHTYPILSMEERMLSILGCKYVDDVLVDAPYVLSSDLLSSLRISVVLTDCGASSEGSTAHHPDIPPCENGTSTGMETKEEESDDHNKIPKEKNILRVVSPTFSITGSTLSYCALRHLLINRCDYCSIQTLLISSCINFSGRNHGPNSQTRGKIQEKVSPSLDFFFLQIFFTLWRTHSEYFLNKQYTVHPNLIQICCEEGSGGRVLRGTVREEKSTRIAHLL